MMKLSEQLQKILKDIKRMRRTGALLKTGADVVLVCAIEATIEEAEQLEAENDTLKRENERLEYKVEARDKEIVAILRKIDELDALLTKEQDDEEAN